MLVLRGLIDESGDGKNFFSLACLVAHDPTWFYLENDWKKLVDAKNAQLISEGRKPIRRYHASDCSNYFGDFKGWTPQEQIDFSKSLLQMFNEYATHGYSLTVNLKDLKREFPEVASNPEGFARVVLLHLLMMQICDNTLKLYPDAIISLVHDRSAYDAAMREAFEQMRNDPNFRCKSRFANIMPMGWEDCVGLQAADLYAYESYREAERQRNRPNRDSRKSLTLILGEGSKFGGIGGGVAEQALLQLKRSIQSLDEETKNELFATARVRPKTEST